MIGFESTNFKFSVVHCNTVYVLSFHSFILIKIYEKITLRIQIWRGKQKLSNCCFTCTLKWAGGFSTSSFIFAIEKPFCHVKFEQFLQWFKCVLFSLIDFAHLIHILCHTNSPLKCTMYVC